MSKVIEYNIACDGGCRDNQKRDNIGAWGVIIEEIREGEVPIRYEVTEAVENTTNNQMELLAGIKALSTIEFAEGVRVNLYTDSAYLFNCITQKWYINWRKNGWKSSTRLPVKNKELWVAFLDLYEKTKSLKVFKSHGHSGERLNTEADALLNKTMDEYFEKIGKVSSK